MNKTILAPLPALAFALILAACGGGGENNKKAYEACVNWAKKQEKYAGVEPAAQDKAEFAGMQDASIAVIIPAKIGDQDAKIQCSVVKNQDGSFSVQSGT
ncbi:MAG: hypothetical protein ACKVSF_01740 [Alphaproteobacteria bacterium]